ncbi:hypothetical protein A2U01_0071014, partial [Trifolium medium]|nr:hypothetical protein [Trifolium medium]
GAQERRGGSPSKLFAVTTSSLSKSVRRQSRNCAKGDTRENVKQGLVGA